MPLTPNFSCSTSLSSPSILTITDTSTGSDVGLTSRRVYLQKADGTYLVPDGTTTDYIVWSIVDASIDIDVLDIDYALNITVNWMTSTVATYTKTILNEFQNYAIIYRYKLIKAISSQSSFYWGANFTQTIFNLTVYMIGADESVSLGNDITNAQFNNTKAKYIIDNPQLAF